MRLLLVAISVNRSTKCNGDASGDEEFVRMSIPVKGTPCGKALFIQVHNAQAYLFNGECEYAIILIQRRLSRRTRNGALTAFAVEQRRCEVY